MFKIEILNGDLSYGTLICRAGFLIYLIVLSIMDIRKKRLNLIFLLSGAIFIIAGRFCDEKEMAVMAAAGILAGGIFLIISRVTGESLGYGDSLLIMVAGGFLGLWDLLSVLAAAFSLAAGYGAVMMIRKKFHRKTAFPFVPFLAAAYMGGLIIDIF